MNRIGLYIHVPFCASRCGYCDFYARVRRDQLQDYLKTLKGEIGRWRGSGLRADSLFFGGGTPSLLPPEEIGGLVRLCREVFDLEGEITLEANPDTVTAESLAALRRGGVNRLSFGVQSAVEEELRLLGRKHSFRQAALAVEQARQAGFDNLSLDIMTGIPQQTMDSLLLTLERITALQPEHLSCYLLKIEEGTPFARRHMEQLCADEDTAAEFYLTLCRYLREKGYAHYEISNFARPGFESRHNLKYWRCEDYLGFGPAAHSCQGGERRYHPADLSSYLESGGQDLCGDGPSGSPEERIMLALRLSEGISPAALPLSFDWAGFSRKCAPYLKAGFMEKTADGLRLTEQGFLLSNSLLAEIL